MATVFAVGDVVQLVGLVSNPSLNGAIATVIGDSNYNSRGRYDVILQSPAAAVAAHPFSVDFILLSLIRMMECARLDCDQVGAKACSGCYCCVECQKKDWKTHKIFCNLVKMMPVTLIPFILM